MAVTPDDLIHDPRWFLAGADPAARRFLYLQTDEQRLQELSFLDGRLPIATVDDGARTLAFEHVLATPPAVRAGIDRLLVHTSFCGSTLLSRLLEGDGEVIAYREPQALVDLSSAASRAGARPDDGEWEGLLQFVLSQYRKVWPMRVAIIKPSNWANVILADLLSASQTPCWAIVTTDLRDYLLANVRGGRDRLGYSLRLLNHLVAAGVIDMAQVRAVEQAHTSSMQQVLRMLVILHSAQHRLLADAEAGSGVPAGGTFCKKDLLDDPLRCLANVAEALAIDLPAEAIERAIRREMPRNAKDRFKSWDPRREQRLDAGMAADIGREIELALAWSRL